MCSKGLPWRAAAARPIARWKRSLSITTRSASGAGTRRRKRSSRLLLPRGGRPEWATPPALTGVGYGHGDHPAGDAVAAVAARVGRIIVGAGVDDQRGAVAVDQCREARPGQADRLLKHAVGRDGDVGHIAAVRAGGIVEAVLPPVRVPVRPAVAKARWAAATDGVDVDAVAPWRQAGRADPEGDAARCLPHPHRTQWLAGGPD